MSRRRSRVLLVGDATYRWTVGHSHRASHTPDGGSRYDDCQAHLVVRRDGTPGRLSIVFGAGAGRLVPDGLLHDGGVILGDDCLNLHRPGVVRAFLDAARDRGWNAPQRSTYDGWTLFEAALHRFDGL